MHAVAQISSLLFHCGILFYSTWCMYYVFDSPLVDTWTFPIFDN
jgi:hypothetical protein